ncbi:uncharacterized protein [Magallana gigas]|uniref:uncharacterized protein isoform X1 n=1 Tax=Magallana gigas TaxID=29159 RepID=UPI003340C8BD
MASIIHAFICCWFLISANADIFSSMTYSTDKPSVPKKKSIFTPGKLNKDAVEKCPDGFVRFQDSCYNFYSEKFSWPEALIFCRAFNYTLVTLTTIDQYTFIKGHLTTITDVSKVQIRSTTPSPYFYGSRFGTPSPYSSRSRFGWQNQNTPRSRIDNLSSNSGGYISSGFWTAGTSADLQGHWKWVTNKQTIDFDQFNATDPTKSSFSGMLLSTNQQSGCLALEKSTGFNVARVDCMTPQHFICERHDSQ